MCATITQPPQEPHTSVHDHGPGLPAVVPKAQAWPGYLNTTSLFPLLLADYAPLPGRNRPVRQIGE